MAEAGPEQKTALHYACAFWDVDMVKVLIQNGADVDAAQKDGGRPLHFVGESGCLEIANLLIHVDNHIVKSEHMTNDISRYGLQLPS